MLAHLLCLLEQAENPFGHLSNDFCLLATEANCWLDLVVLYSLYLGLGKLLDWNVNFYLYGLAFLQGTVGASLADLNFSQLRFLML